MSLLSALQQHQTRSNKLSNNSNIDVDKLQTGSVVVVRSGFGDEAPETVTLLGVEYDDDKGEVVIDYVDRKGDGRWAYTNQIKKVISY